MQKINETIAPTVPLPLVYVDTSFSLSNQFKSNGSISVDGNSNNLLDLKHGRSNIDRIIDKLRRVYECIDSNKAKSLFVITDISIGSNFTSTLLQYVKDIFPAVLIVCANILPLVPEKLHGYGLLNAILTLQSTLELSDGVMLRGFEDIQQLLTTVDSVTKPSASALPNLHDLQCALAGDLLIAFSKPLYAASPADSVYNDQYHSSSVSNEFEHILWPLNVCTPQRKLFDVRSSCWKLYTKRQSNIPYNALRAMSANLHSLHLTSSSYYSYDSIGKKTTKGMFDYVGDTIEIANLVDLTLDSKNHRSFSISKTRFYSTDVKVALNWAAPSVQWPESLGVPVKRDARTGLVRKTAASSSSSSSVVTVGGVDPLSYPSASISTATAPAYVGGRSSTTTPASSSPFGNSHANSVVSALAFNSIYAQLHLNHVLSSATTLIDRGAFIHKFSDLDIRRDDFYDAIDTISSHVSIHRR